MTERVQAGILRLAFSVDHAGHAPRGPVTTMGPTGIARWPVMGLRLPDQASARWRTCTVPRARSTSLQRKPRSSEARSSLKAAVTRKARRGPGSAAARIRRTSSGLGISRPTSKRRCAGLSAAMVTSSAKSSLGHGGAAKCPRRNAVWPC
jgi:hypothetical protein